MTTMITPNDEIELVNLDAGDHFVLDNQWYRVEDHMFGLTRATELFSGTSNTFPGEMIVKVDRDMV